MKKYEVINLSARANTNRLIELAEEGLISWKDIATAALSYMSEYDVTDMCRLNDWDNND